MDWSFPVGRIFNIPIRIHWLFLLLPFSTIINFNMTLSQKLFSLVLTSIIFFCVFLHELGHSVVAQYYRIKVNSILLWPLGGVAQMDIGNITAKEEIAIAIAGPSVNFFLASIFLGISLLMGLPNFENEKEQTFKNLPFYVMLVNTVMGTFNLVPAFPMDGGRILRAALSLKLGPSSATFLATKIGQFIAGVGFFLGIFNREPMLVITAFFIWLGATAEQQRNNR